MEQKRRHLEIIGDVVEKFNNSIVSEVRVLLVVIQEKAIHTNYLIIGKPTHKHTNISQRKTDNQHCTRRVVARALRDVLLAYQPKLEFIHHTWKGISTQHVTVHRKIRHNAGPIKKIFLNFTIIGIQLDSSS